MKNLLQTLKSARRIELLIITVFLCILMLMMLSGGEETSASSTEERMADALSSIAGAGKVRVMLSGEEKTEGAVVISEGADDLSVMLTLQRTVHVLTGLPIEKIEVIKSE